MKQTYEAKDLAEIAAEFRRRAVAEIENAYGEARASAWKDAADILDVTTLKRGPIEVQPGFIVHDKGIQIDQ